MTTQNPHTKHSLRSGARSPSLRSGAQPNRSGRVAHRDAHRPVRARRRVHQEPPRAYVIDNLARGVILGGIIGAALWLLFSAS